MDSKQKAKGGTAGLHYRVPSSRQWAFFREPMKPVGSHIVDPICIEMYHSLDHDRTVLVLVDYKASSRCKVQEVYLWSPTSGVNIQV
jgi:hypothetical protein